MIVKDDFSHRDEENKSLRNIIIYSGNTHTQNINQFLSNLPKLRLLSEPISNRFGKRYFEKQDTKKVSPKLSFGRFGIFDGSELQFPTNFDYFGYNGKIIDKLKQETNVQNYLQIEKKLIQKQEERKMKQQQQQKKRKEERKRKIEEETKKRRDQYNKIVQLKGNKMQQRWAKKINGFNQYYKKSRAKKEYFYFMNTGFQWNNDNHDI